MRMLFSSSSFITHDLSTTHLPNQRPHVPSSSHSLPTIINRRPRRTTDRNSIRMIRIRLPSDRPITANINILIRNHTPRRKRNSPNPHMIRIRILARRKRYRTSRSPIPESRHTPNNLNRLPKTRGDSFFESHSYSRSSGTRRRSSSRRTSRYTSNRRLTRWKRARRCSGIRPNSGGSDTSRRNNSSRWFDPRIRDCTSTTCCCCQKCSVWPGQIISREWCSIWAWELLC